MRELITKKLSGDSQGGFFATIGVIKATAFCCYRLKDVLKTCRQRTKGEKDAGTDLLIHHTSEEHFRG
jgi:hypothetical protein